MMCYRTGNWL